MAGLGSEFMVTEEDEYREEYSETESNDDDSRKARLRAILGADGEEEEEAVSSDDDEAISSDDDGDEEAEEREEVEEQCDDTEEFIGTEKSAFPDISSGRFSVTETVARKAPVTRILERRHPLPRGPGAPPGVHVTGAAVSYTNVQQYEKWPIERLRPLNEEEAFHFAEAVSIFYASRGLY